MASRVDRRLAAIMAVDVVGYSRLVGLDEAGTLARVKAHRVELAEPLIAEYHGRVVKLTGDGALVEFASAVDAVECAVAVQNGTVEREAHEPEARRIRFRIGINIGDIVLEDGDIFGDGVNVASRLEGLADPGGICIARNVYNQVKGKLDLGFEPMGAHEVKNIAEWIEVYRVLPEASALTSAIGLKRAGTRRWRWAALAATTLAVVIAGGGASWWYAGQPGLEEIRGAAFDGAAEAKPALLLPDKPSIAVLPFDNLSGEERYERLADGITEDIITDLSRFRELFVIARNSTFVYKEKPTDVRQIARELGVQYVLEGSLQAEGDRVRVTAQLIDATSGNHVWSERYDRPLEDVFAIQDEVTQQIAASLGGTHGIIARAGRETAKRKSPESLQAYEYYLLGMEHKHRFTPEDNGKAQELFARALELDPTLARAYVGLAWTYNIDYDRGWGTGSPQEKMKNWLEASRTAISVDPLDGEAHLTLGLYFAYKSDSQKARAEVEEAVSLNPNSSDVLLQSAFVLPWVGKPDQAVQNAERAVRLNPHHPDWYYGGLADGYFHTGQYQKALDAIHSRKSALSVWQYFYLAQIQARLGGPAEAAAAKAELLQRFTDYSLERWLSEMGGYARETELNRVLENHEKAGLALCATAEQLAKYPDMKRLEQCEQQRASG